MIAPVSGASSLAYVHVAAGASTSGASCPSRNRRRFLERSRNPYCKLSPSPSPTTAYRSRQARAETIGTFSNDLGIAIATPIRKALSEPQDTDCVAVTANSVPENNRLGGLREMFRISGRKKECNTRTSQGVTHPSTTLAQARLTSEF